MSRAYEIPHGIPLDYSIEAFGLQVAWGVFDMKLRDAGVSDVWTLSEVAYWRVKSRFLCGDTRGYLVALMDAGAMSEDQMYRFLGRPFRGEAKPVRTTSAVFKWVPGDHYYALGQKFGTLAEAQAHLGRSGHEYGGLRERHVYREDA